VDKLLESEVAQLRSPDALVHLSVNDFKFFEKELPAKAHFLALPTIDQQFISSVKAATPLPEPIDLLFVAHWHLPNLTAIQWFFKNVWPLVADRNYKFRIVGRIGMLAEGQAPELYEQFRDCFVGEVVDLAPHYRSARCVIAPMISGSGISIKTIEAFALGKAFVGTAKAFRGMPMERLEELGVHAYDEPQAFADAIISTMNNLPAAERVSQAAYDALFSTKACFAVRDESLDAAMRRTNGSQAVVR
jgi:polysaccharide biosynthesis protein PslH